MIRNALLGMAALALVPQAAEAQVLATVNAEAKPSVLIGFLGTGTEAEMQKLEAAAQDKGFSHGRSKNNKGEAEVMVLVRDDVDPAGFWPFYRDALGGKFGRLAYDVIVAPRTANPDAKDYLESARVYPSSSIAESGAPSPFMAGVKDHPTPMVVLGFIATGAESPMAALEKGAEGAKFRHARSKGRQGEPDVMVFANASDSPAQFWSLYRQGVAGKFGKLGMELIVVSTRFDPGNEDYLDRARVYDSSQVIEPKN